MAVGFVHENSYYTIVEGPSWTQAEKNANNLGGNLFASNNLAENTAISLLFVGENKSYLPADQDIYWIGLSKSSGAWRWSNGDSVSFFNWGPLEPYEASGIFDRGEIIVEPHGGSPWTTTAGNWNNNSDLISPIGRYGIAEIPLSYFTISDATFTEGKGGDVTITRTGGTSTSQRLKIVSSDGSATLSNYDYTQVNKTVTFAAGETSKTINISTTADLNVESDESFSLTMTAEGSDDVPPQITDGSATVIINEPASYSISHSKNKIKEDMYDEGLAGESNWTYISTTNVDEGTWLYFSITGAGINQADFSTPLEGGIQIDSNGKGEYLNTVLKDNVIEGDEPFTVKLFTDMQRTNLVATSGTISIIDASIKTKSPTYSLSTSASSIDEKSQSSVRFNISTTDVDANTRLYYTVSGIGSGITSSDFLFGNIRSSRLIGSDSKTTFVLFAAADKTTEGPESFDIKLYSDYQRTNLVATSSSISIADTSKAKKSAALLSASVKAKTITLNFDSSLSNSKPNSQRFTVTADGKSIDISSSSLDADAGSLKLNLASSIKSKQTVKLAYTDLKGDQSKGVLQTTDGSDLASFSTDVSNNSSDSTAPIVTGASINGKVLSISFDEAIAKATPSNRSWTLKEDGKAISITSAYVDSNSAQLDLILATAVDRGSNIILSYSDISGDQKANVIQDIAGNDLASFTNFSVENQTTRSSDLLDLNTAEINGNEIVLAFNRELSSTTPSKGTFRLRANNKDIKVNSITLFPNDREAVLKIASPVANGDNVILSYTDAQGNQTSNVIEDIDGNDLATISNFKLTNNTRKSATDFEVDYADADGKIINVYLTDSLSSSIPKASLFRVTADKRKQKISSVSTSESDGTITLNLKKSINPKQDILISYRDLKGNQRSGIAEDTDGNDLASFQNLSPINDTSSFDEITDNNPPALEDAYLDGTELVLEFDKILQTGKVSPSRFKLRAGRTRVRVASALVPQDDNSTAIVTLKYPLTASANSLTLAYKDLRGDQSSFVIQDDSGNDLASLRNFDVEIIGADFLA